VLAPAAALAASGRTGHSVAMTEVTHGVFDAGLIGPNPCTGADIVSQGAPWHRGESRHLLSRRGEVRAAFTGHEARHFALNANGVVTVSFDRMTLTGGCDTTLRENRFRVGRDGTP
jgi:hypothetical protein